MITLTRTQAEITRKVLEQMLVRIVAGESNLQLTQDEECAIQDLVFELNDQLKGQ